MWSSSARYMTDLVSRSWERNIIFLCSVLELRDTDVIRDAYGQSECNQSSSVLFCFQDGIFGGGTPSSTFSSARRFISRFERA